MARMRLVSTRESLAAWTSLHDALMGREHSEYDMGMLGVGDNGSQKRHSDPYVGHPPPMSGHNAEQLGKPLDTDCIEYKSANGVMHDFIGLGLHDGISVDGGGDDNVLGSANSHAFSDGEDAQHYDGICDDKESFDYDHARSNTQEFLGANVPTLQASCGIIDAELEDDLYWGNQQTANIRMQPQFSECHDREHELGSESPSHIHTDVHSDYSEDRNSSYNADMYGILSLDVPPFSPVSIGSQRYPSSNPPAMSSINQGVCDRYGTDGRGVFDDHVYVPPVPSSPPPSSTPARSPPPLPPSMHSRGISRNPSYSSLASHPSMCSNYTSHITCNLQPIAVNMYTNQAIYNPPAYPRMSMPMPSHTHRTSLPSPPSPRRTG